MLLVRRLAFVTLCLATLASARIAIGDNYAQVIVSATPVAVELPSPLPFVVTPESQATSTQTRTPTPVGPVLLEAISEANVRSEPDPESEQLGTIRTGDLYPIIGRYYRWLQFQYDQTRSGWVFDELVKITGDESLVRDLTVNVTPTADTASVNATETALAVLIPSQGTLVLPVFPAQAESQLQVSTPLISGEVLLPTFTFPPNVLLLPTGSSGEFEGLSTPSENEQADQLEVTLAPNVPPIAPILILGGVGIAGLVISASLRRK